MNVNRTRKTTSTDNEETMLKGERMDKIQETIEYLMDIDNTVQDVGKRYQAGGYEGAAHRLFPGASRIKLNLSTEKKHEVNKELCSRIKAGDSRAEQALILFNFPMLHQAVSQKCRDYEETVEDYEDVLLECANYLVEKIAYAFNPNGAPFYYYAKDCIQRHAGDFCKELKTDTVSLDEPRVDEEGNMVTLADVTADEKTSGYFDLLCLLESARTEVEKLPEKQKVVLSMVTGLGEYDETPPQVIAKRYGVKPQKVYEIYKQALDTLRKNLDIKPAA